jgi:hypothetical protein
MGTGHATFTASAGGKAPLFHPLQRRRPASRRLRQPYVGLRTGIQNGIFSVNDVRELENMDRLSEEEGGDLHILNGNVVKLADAGSAYTSNTEKGGTE